MKKTDLYTPSKSVSDSIMKRVSRSTVRRLCKQSTQKVTNSFSDIYFSLRESSHKQEVYTYSVFEQTLNESNKSSTYW